MSIKVDRTGRVALITLDSPRSLNALTVADLLDLREHLTLLQDDDDVRCIVITGAGDKAFCSGADLKSTSPPDEPFVKGALRGRVSDSRHGGYARLLDLSDLEIWKPIIAAINGYCLGGGLELALQCDIRIAGEGASFGLPEVKVASIPAAGGVQMLMRAVPAAHAMKMALTGERISADAALQIGLVSDVVTNSALMDAAFAMATTIASNGPLAVQIVKKLAVESSHLSPREAIKHAHELWGHIRDSEDRIEGRRAFAQKRSPVYRGV